MTEPEIADADIEAYGRDGVVCLRGAFAGDWAERLAAGVGRNMAAPGPYAGEYGAGGKGFFGDYCNWQRIPEYRDFVFESPAAAIAARLMGSTTAQFFHEHVLVKEPGSAEVTPWHHDYPYYCIEGRKTVSLWVALDPVPGSAALRFVAGSQAWNRLFTPRYFKDGAEYEADGAFEAVPDIEADADAYPMRSWALEPGDALAFDFRTLHGAPGNPTGGRRRAFAARWIGDDVRYA